MLLPEEQRFSDTAPNPSTFHETPETSRSYWIREYQIDFEAECKAAKLPEEVDVLIIGTGLTGAACAYRLSEADPTLRVAMLEARGICTGATGRNGGHLTRAEAYDFRDLAKVFGEQEAIRLRKMTLMNRDMMLEAMEKLGVAETVELNLSGSAAIFASQQERERFAADMEAARKHGYECECRIMDADELKQV